MSRAGGVRPPGERAAADTGGARGCRAIREGAVADVAYAAMIAAPLVLARRLRSEPGWAAVTRVLPVLAILSAAALVLFASRAAKPRNGTVQRVAVTLALAAEVLMAARILTLRHPRRAGPG